MKSEAARALDLTDTKSYVGREMAWLSPIKYIFILRCYFDGCHDRYEAEPGVCRSD